MKKLPNFLRPKTWEKDTRIFAALVLTVVVFIGVFSLFSTSDAAMRDAISDNMKQLLAADETLEHKQVVKTENSLFGIKYFSYATTGNNPNKEAYLGIFGQVYDVTTRTYRLISKTESITSLLKVDEDSGEETVWYSTREGGAGEIRMETNQTEDAYEYRYYVDGALIASRRLNKATGASEYYTYNAAGQAVAAVGFSIKFDQDFAKAYKFVRDSTGAVIGSELDGDTIEQDENGVLCVNGTAYRDETDGFGATVGKLVNYTYRLLGCGQNMMYGAKLTILLTFLSVLLGMILSVFLALGKISRFALIRVPCNAYIFFFRGTPLMIQLFVIYFAIPGTIDGFTWPGIFAGSGTEAASQGAFLAALIAFTLNSAAYCAEIVRAAIQSIDKGQHEAAKALGMNYAQTMSHIIIPQSIRRLIPPVANEFIMVLKDASLVFVISLMDITTISKTISASGDFLVFIPALVIYLIITAFFSFLFTKLEKRFSVYE